MNERSDQAEREFWLEIRRGFLLVVTAIDKRFKVGRFEPSERSMEASPQSAPSPPRYLNTNRK